MSETLLVFDGKGVGRQNSSEEVVSCDSSAGLFRMRVISHHK